MVTAHVMFGSTSLLPTLIKSDITKLEEAADVVSQAIRQSMPGIIGVHFEGPHLNVTKKSIHNNEHIRKISKDELQTYCRKDLGKVLVTVAPESILPEQIPSVTPEQPFYYYRIPACTGVYVSMLALLKAVDGRIANFAGIKYTFKPLLIHSVSTL